MALIPEAANTEENSAKMDDRSALPAGKYLAQIVKSEMKPTSKKNGHYLSLHWKVIEGPVGSVGRMFFSNLNLVNPSAVTVEIAKKELNSIAEAMDQQGVLDSDELHQIPAVVTLKIKPATAQWPEGNDATSFEPADTWEGIEEPEGIETDEEPALEGEFVPEEEPTEEPELETPAWEQ